MTKRPGEWEERQGDVDIICAMSSRDLRTSSSAYCVMLNVNVC